MRVTRMTMRVMCHCKMRATCLGGRGPYKVNIQLCSRIYFLSINISLSPSDSSHPLSLSLSQYRFFLTFLCGQWLKKKSFSCFAEMEKDVVKRVSGWIKGEVKYYICFYKVALFITGISQLEI